MQEELLEIITLQLADKLNKKIIVEQVQQVYGGDINQTFLMCTSSEDYFLKLNSDSFNDMFEKEFNGLHTLRNAQVIHVPKPLLFGKNHHHIYLVMEYIEKGKPKPTFWQQFAEGLASLHRQTQPQFGFKEDNYIGSLGQENKLTNTWAEFYATHRIMPLMRKALQQGKCSGNDVSKTEKLCHRFDEVFPKEPPALLHGDLWSGNFMVTKDGKALIYDPAVYYGHREMDLAMSLLFGGFDKSFYDHYNETFPLEKNWQQRVSLCQLYPLLVHLILFGGHYYYSVMNIVDSFS